MLRTTLPVGLLPSGRSMNGVLSRHIALRRLPGSARGFVMYEAYYGLREKPFSILPDPELIYWGANHRLAFAMLEFGVMNNAGFTVITGEIGSGKTTLLRYLLRRLDPRVVVGLDVEHAARACRPAAVGHDVA